MPRAIWKGSITFGLVYIPVRLFPAVRNDDIDFDWLDKRSMAPVGYRRINKETGKEIDRKFIVRGYQYKPDHYVALSDEEIRAANPKATQSVDILGFAKLSEVSFLYFETPYYLAPDKKGEKVYALLREALDKTGKIGIARVVMHTKQHLAALIPAGNALVLNTLRWADEMRDVKDLDLPARAKQAGITTAELSMAVKLIDDMTGNLDLSKYRDSFRDDILALVKRKVKAGKTEVVETPEKAPEPAAPSNVIDLTELLKRSLNGATNARQPAKRKARSAHAAKPRTNSPNKRAS